MIAVTAKSDLASVSANKAEILNALEHDPEFFIQFFLGDELTFPVPKFHTDIFLVMTSPKVKRFVCAIPRDHAKTTLAKLAVVWLFLFSPYRFIIYLSNTSRISVDAVLDIRSFLLSDNFMSVFGPPEFMIDRQGEGIYKFKIGDKICILRALGAAQQVRGINIDNQRPQCAVVDDLEDNDNIANETLFEKLENWFYGPFLKCLDKFDNKIIQLGNMISNRQMLKNHCESKRWYSMKFGCLLANGQPLWPDAWPLKKLKEDYQEYLERGKLNIWYAEMMNMPLAKGKGLISVDKLFYLPEPHPSDILYAFITVDLAISKKDWAHKTAVVVHGWDGEIWRQCEWFAEYGVDPIDLLDKIIELCYKWRTGIVGIETVAFQAALKSVYDYINAIRGVDWMHIIELYYAMKKSQRLAGWCTYINKKEYALIEGDFVVTEQLLDFDPRKDDNDDDIIDASAYFPQMVTDYIYEIMNQKDITQAHEVQMLENYARV